MESRCRQPRGGDGRLCLSKGSNLCKIWQRAYDLTRYEELEEVYALEAQFAVAAYVKGGGGLVAELYLTL